MAAPRRSSIRGTVVRGDSGRHVPAPAVAEPVADPTRPRRLLHHGLERRAALRRLVRGGALVHLMGERLSLDGQILSSDAAGEVVINAVSAATLHGSASASAALRVHAGVQANWSDSRLLGTLTVADLSGGDIWIDGAALSSDGSAEIRAGGDVQVLGSATAGDNVQLKRPSLVTTSRTVDVVTGTHQVALGAILVPVVSFTTTAVTEQVGTESVRIGSEFNTADVTLTQLGYYNASTKLYREKFMLGESQSGYLPLYNVSFANLTTHRVINGIPSESAWHPAWENNYTLRTVDTTFEYTPGSSQPTITYKEYANSAIWNLPVAGWDDKYVYLPAGAEKDILRLVSQGEPLSFQEDVGDTYDAAKVTYTQDKSALVASTSSYVNVRDIDQSIARWSVSYLNSGLQWYELTDGRTLNTPYTPTWVSGSPTVSDRKSTRLNSSHVALSRMPSSA